MSIAIDPLIQGKLQQFIGRRRRWGILYAFLVAATIWLLGVLLFTWIDATWILDRTVRSLLSLATYLVAGVTGLVIGYRRLRDTDPLTGAAIAIEKETPELKDQLLSAVELARSGEASGSGTFIGALQQNVAGKIRAVDVRSLLPLKMLSRPIAIATGIVLICGLLTVFPELQFGRRLARAIIPGFDIDRVSRTQIIIERPTPATCSVPANEIVPIVMHLEGELDDRATLQWRSQDGGYGKVAMGLIDPTASATALPGESETPGESSSEPRPTFAANLQVNESPVEYRILAGDGMTRWQLLTPHPRPQALEFAATVSPPDYTKLPSIEAVSDAGHVTGLVGSVVNLQVKFNVPVEDVVMRRLNQGEQIPLSEVDGQWTATTKLDIDDRYQILARSVETGFDNPLSPQYTLTPIADLAPIAKWKTDPSQAASSARRRELVTAFSKVNMAGTVTDEMPIDVIAQEYSVNNGEWLSLDLQGSPDSSTSEQKWMWDLQLIRHNERELSAGDVIQTRIVAVDRKGQRGESAIKEFIVSDQQFDSARIARMQSWMALAEEIAKWRATVTEELVRLKVEDPKDAENADDEPSVTNASETVLPIAKLNADLASRVDMIGKMIDAAAHESEAAKLETLALDMHRVQQALVTVSESPDDKRRDYRWLTQHADATEMMAKVELGHQLGMVLVDNVQRMAATIQPTARKSDPIDWTTFGRYFEVTREQHQEMTRLIESVMPGLPESTRRHSENLLRWIDEEQRRLTEAIAQKDTENVVREVARHTLEDLSRNHRTNVVDDQLQHRQNELLKHSQNALGWTRDVINKMIAQADEINRQKDKAKSDNSEEVRKAKEEIAKAREKIKAIEASLREQFTIESNLHRRRPEADQRYLADMRLLERVLQRVGDDDFAMPEGKNLRDIYQEIANAYFVLESGHDVLQWGRELRSLADDDRWYANGASGRVDHPNRIDRFRNGIEYPSNAIAQTGLPGEVMGPIHELRWNPQISNIADIITSRRWRVEDAVSAADKLDRHHVSFVTATTPLEPHMTEARKKLEALLPSIPELARKTAQTLRESQPKDEKEKAEKTKQEEQKKKEEQKKEEQEKEEAEKAEQERTDATTEPKSEDSQKDEPKSTEPAADDKSADDKPVDEAAAESPSEAEELDEVKATAEELRAQAETQAQQLRESLADEANTQELISEEGRRKARNADISRKAIEERMKDVKEAAEELEAAESMDSERAAAENLKEKTETAAKTLEQIAMHYELEKAAEEAGNEAAMPQGESPLQALEQELGLTKPLDQQFAKSNALADALNSDPRELLKKLQAELKRNPLMREELETITDRTMTEAQRALEEQAARERELQLQLEKSDPQLTVAKRELEEAIRRTAEVGLEVERSLLAAANQAADSLRNLPEQSAQRASQAKEELQNASKSLNEAVKDAREVPNADNALLSELQERAASIQAELQEASGVLKENDKPIAEIMQDAEAKLEEKARNEEKRQMENIQRRARDTQVQAARDQERRANERLRQAEKEAREATTRLNREQENLRKIEERQAKNPDDQGLKNEAARLEKEISKAQALAKAAEAGLELRQQTSEATQQRAQEAGQNPLPPLDQPRPAAQLAQSMQQQASEQLAKASENLQAAVETAASVKSIQPSADAIASTDNAQQRVASDVAETAEALARSARHQQRLGQVDNAQETSQAAAAVKEIAEGAVQQASESLSAAREAMSPPQNGGDAPPPSPQNAAAQATSARQALQQSQSALKAQAEQLAQSSQVQQASSPTDQQSGDSPSSGQPGNDAQGAAKQSAQQMARTLDELDRTLSAAQRRQSQNEGSPSDTPSQSPATLAAAARKQAQQMAMQRSQLGQAPNQPPGQNDQPSPATESGDGTSKAMADLFGLDEIDRNANADWGKLRSREAEEVAEERRIEISPEYRRQIEAYFRVIAEKGKE